MDLMVLLPDPAAVGQATEDVPWEDTRGYGLSAWIILLVKREPQLLPLGALIIVTLAKLGPPALLDLLVS